MRRSIVAGVMLAIVFLLTGRSHAANLLFVSDCGGGQNIATVLQADGHIVTSVLSDFSGGYNATLAGPVTQYDVIFWVASGTGSGSTHDDAAVFTNLEAYCSAGGRVFVTGYDSIASPTDPNLIAFLGGTSSQDLPGAPGALISLLTDVLEPSLQQFGCIVHDVACGVTNEVDGVFDTTGALERTGIHSDTQCLR